MDHPADSLILAIVLVLPGVPVLPVMMPLSMIASVVMARAGVAVVAAIELWVLEV